MWRPYIYILARSCDAPEGKKTWIQKLEIKQNNNANSPMKWQTKNLLKTDYLLRNTLWFELKGHCVQYCGALEAKMTYIRKPEIKK